MNAFQGQTCTIITRCTSHCVETTKTSKSKRHKVCRTYCPTTPLHVAALYERRASYVAYNAATELTAVSADLSAKLGLVLIKYCVTEPALNRVLDFCAETTRVPFEQTEAFT